MIRNTIVAASVAVLAISTSPALAAATHYWTQDNYLFRYDDTQPLSSRTYVELKKPDATSFGTSTSGRFAGLAFDPAGTLWGSTGTGELYTINPGTGATTLKFDTGTNAVPTFDFRQNGSTLEILATTTLTGGNSQLTKYNAVTGAVIGSPVDISVSQNNAGNPASGYDPTTNLFYLARGGASSSATNDFTITAYNANDFSVASGPTDTGLTWSSAAGAFYNGAFYFGFRPGTDGGLGNWNLPNGSGNVNFGRLNLSTGAYTEDFEFNDLTVAGGTPAFTITSSNNIPSGPSFGYALAPVPEPGTYALLGLGLLTMLGIARRKRA